MRYNDRKSEGGSCCPRVSFSRDFVHARYAGIKQHGRGLTGTMKRTTQRSQNQRKHNQHNQTNQHKSHKKRNRSSKIFVSFH
jgi:hypothetical protein